LFNIYKDFLGSIHGGSELSDNRFFKESLEQSRIKAEIVSSYFWAWAKIVIPTARHSAEPRIAYIDLFAGPGRYEDQTKSTPILVLERAVKDRDMRNMLVTIFNDVDADNTRSLERAIYEIPGISQLRYRPLVQNNEVGENIVKIFEQIHLVPTLFFVDPWGYKGLSLRLINSVLKDWGCDCIFFFNYNRINMGLSNEKVGPHMDALFGEQRAGQIRLKLANLSSEERELTIVNEIAQAIRDMGGKYVLPFRFHNELGNRTSHHLIFVSKNFKGYEVMKGVMAGRSTKGEEGVSTFEYNPASNKQPLLYLFRPRPLSELKQSLVETFKGQTLAMRTIYERHSVDTPYIDTNYKDALRQLEEEGAILADPAAAQRKKRKGIVTFADTVKVTFL
jgi:three-Cys-motif partner protein